MIETAQIEEANKNPGDFTASSLGNFSGHVGAYYRLRKPGERSPEDPIRDAYRASTTNEKKIFHTPLERLAKQHLNQKTNDLQGFLTALRTFQSEKLWGGDIPNLTTASQIPNDYRAKSNASATLRGRHTATYAEGTGITTGFEEATTVANLQDFAREAKERNERIMDNRINAIVQQWNSSNVPQPLSNFTMRPVTSPAYIVDPSGKSVADYDRDIGYDASKLESVAYGGDVQIDEDMEPDEDYVVAPTPSNQPTPAPVQVGSMPREVLAKFGKARSAVTQQVEQRFKAVTTEVQQLFNTRYESEIARLKEQVTQALKTIDLNAADLAQQKALVFQQAQLQEQAIVLKYQNESRRQYELYVQKKQLLDLKLHEEETRQTTPESLQTLLETYLKAVDTLLSAYVADMKSVLSL